MVCFPLALSLTYVNATRHFRTRNVSERGSDPTPQGNEDFEGAEVTRVATVRKGRRPSPAHQPLGGTKGDAPIYEAVIHGGAM